MAQKLANAGVNIGRVTNIVVIERGEKDERVRKLRFDGTEGSHTVTFETCRTILGLKSQYYYIREENTGGAGARRLCVRACADGRRNGICNIKRRGRTWPERRRDGRKRRDRTRQWRQRIY